MKTLSGDAISDLLARVEKAAGPDRELDAEILIASGCQLRQRGMWEIIEWPDGERISAGLYRDRIPVTDSLDAALALVERVLPGASVQISLHRSIGRSKVRVACKDSSAVYGDSADTTPALALLAALLKAPQASQSRTPPEGQDVSVRIGIVLGCAMFNAMPLVVFSAPVWCQWTAAGMGILIALVFVAAPADREDRR